MGKQTKISGSHFGGEWTKQKLYIIDHYLGAYSIALKNQKVKRIYVDGFAGSGKTELKSKCESENYTPISLWGEEEQSHEETVIDGSALLSLKYDFDEYYFLELDESRISILRANIEREYPKKLKKVHFVNGDTNRTLLDVVSKITKYDRCLMFLDPYALELKWETLEAIAGCGVVDLWYLFPLSMVRLLDKGREISEANRQKVSSILGTDEWYDKLFVKSSQISLFGDEAFTRVSYEDILKYIKDRFSSIFPFVSPDSKVLRNEVRKSPMFMLCFMMTNTSPKAQSLAAKLVKDIIKKTEKL